MLLKILLVLLVLLLVGLSLYIYSYANSRVTIDMGKLQCVSPDCNIIWNDTDKKCYPSTVKNGQCIETGTKNGMENWQRSLLVTLTVLIALVSLLVIFLK